MLHGQHFEKIYRKIMKLPADNNSMFESGIDGYVLRQTRIAYITFIETLNYASEVPELLHQARKSLSRKGKKPVTVSQTTDAPRLDVAADDNIDISSVRSIEVVTAPFYSTRKGVTFVDLLDLFAISDDELTKKYCMKYLSVSEFCFRHLMASAKGFGFMTTPIKGLKIKPVNLFFIIESGALDCWREAVANYGHIKPLIEFRIGRTEFTKASS